MADTEAATPVDPEEALKGKLHFPGFGGVPFLGTSIPDLKTGDVKNEPVIQPFAYVRILDLSNPAHLKAYEAISSRVADSRSVISFEDRQYDPDTKSWRVLIRWVDNYAVLRG